MPADPLHRSASPAPEPAPAAASATREQLRLVVVGHVDHGKSTLIGRLLHDTGSLREGVFEHLQAVAARRGMPFEFANLTDALQAERDQNVTIDTSQVWFRSPRRDYVLIDAPGHVEFLKNMVTGAARADAAIVVIDASEGVRDQSRRHGRLLSLLGIDQVAVVVNKLDLVGYSREAYEQVVHEYTTFLASLGLRPRAVVPAVARDGDNLARPSAHLSWYTGGTVLDVLDDFVTRAPDRAQPLRLPVQAVYRYDARRIVAGRLESGELRVGDRLLFLPSGKQSTVKTIEQWPTATCQAATTGQSVGLTLTDPLFLARGEVASHLHDVPQVATQITARVFWLGRTPLVKGRVYRLKLATQEVECEVVSIAQAIDAESLAASGTGEADQVRAHEIGEVTLRTRRPLALDPYRHVPSVGRFVLVDDLDVAGGGVILTADASAAARTTTSANLTPTISHVPAEARHARNGHRGAVVWFTGLSGSGKSTLARAIERELFDRGWQVVVLDGDNLRTGLNSDLGFSEADRAENIRRVAEVARLFAENGVIAVTAFISPTRRDRLEARRIAEEADTPVPFVEVHLNTPLATCESRDPKGLYARARQGLIPQFTGVSAPFEAPDTPDLALDTSALSVEDAADRLLSRLTAVVQAIPEGR